MSVVAIVPAAGRSERFGSPKLVADAGGVPLLERTLRSLLDAGLTRVLVVVAPDAALDIVGSLHDPRVVRVVNPDPSRGMFSSIQCGAAAAPAETPMLVLPADMPFVKPATIRALLHAHTRSPARVVVPTHGGRRGHPIVLPAAARMFVVGAGGEPTLKHVLVESGLPHVSVEVDDPGVLRDVDTPNDIGPGPAAGLT